MAIFTTFIATVAASGWIAALTTTAIGNFITGLALNALSAALAGKPPKPKKAGITGEIQQGADIPRAFILGRYATAGSLAYHNHWGGSDNEYYTRITVLSDLPVTGLAEVWIDGERVTLDLENPDPDGKGYPVFEYSKTRTRTRQVEIRDRGGAPATGFEEEEVTKAFAWVKFHDGTQTTADSFVVDKVSTEERPWTAAEVGHGVAYAVTTFRMNRKLFQGFPKIIFVLDGIEIYDPQSDSTGPSENPGVQARALLEGLSYGGAWFYGPQSAGRVVDAEWADEIAKCALPVPGTAGMTDAEKTAAFGSTTVPARYRAGLEVTVDRPVAEVLEDILAACNGRISEVGTRYRFQVGDPAPATATLTDDDILSTAGQSFAPFFPLAETVNAVTATYPEPAEGWQSQEAPPLYNAEFEADDGNRRLPTTVELDAVPYREQVQRLMASALSEARRARRHTVRLPGRYWALEPGDFVSWTSERNGYDDKLMRVDGLVDLPDGDVSIDVTEVDPTDYDWSAASDYTPVASGSIAPQALPDLAITGWSIVATTIFDGGDAERRPAILIAWTDPERDDVTGVQWRIRVSATGVAVPGGTTADVEAERHVISEGILPGETYEVQARFRAGDRQASWTPWTPVSTADIRLDYVDLVPDVQQEIDQAQAEAENAAGDAAAADLKAQTVRNLHDALVDGFGYGDLAAGFSSVDTTIKVTRKNLQAAMSSTNEVQTPDASNPENTNSAGEPIGQWSNAAASTDVPASAPAGAKSIKVTDGAREMPGKATSAANRVIKVMSWVKSSGGYRPAIRNPGGGILASVSTDFETTPTWTYKTWFLEVPASVTGKWCPAWDMTDETVEVWFYDLRWEDVTEVDALGASVIQQSVAIADLQGNASAGYLVKAQAGGEVSLLDLIAADGSAGAVSVARLQASLILLNGTVSAELLSVGFGRNLLPNTDFSAGLDHWLLRGPSTDENAMSLRIPPASWSGEDYPTLMIYQSTGTSAGYVDLVAQPIIKADGTTARGVQIEVGKRYEARVQISTHRCTGELRIQWLNAAGDAIAYSGPVSIPTQTSDSANPNNWPAFVIRGNPPDSAVRASIHIRKLDTMAGQTNSYMFVHKPQLAETVPNASENVPYDVGVSTLITGTGIVANTITADKLNAASLAVAGLAIFGGDLRSADFVSGSAGWRIDQDGSAEFNNLVVRSWVQEGAVSDGARGVSQAPSTVGDGGTVLLIQTGPIGFDQFWHFTFNAEIRRLGKTAQYFPGSKAGPEHWLVYSRRTGLIFEYRLYDGASWGSWVRLDTISTGVGSNDAWQQVGFTEHFQGVYADAQLRLRVYEALEEETTYYADPGIDWTQDNIRNAGLVAKALVR